METLDFKKILKSLQRYYPLGLYDIEDGYDDIRKIVEGKVTRKLPIMDNWTKFIEELNTETPFLVDDCYYFQYPNLKVIIEDKITVEGITVHKRFIVCFSLLCPCFSYFYEYLHSVKRETSGWLMLGGTYFLKDDNYENFKIDLDLEAINKLISKYFPDYSFSYHFSLMHKEISGGFPFGNLIHEGIDRKFSLYQYLFDNSYHKNNIDI